MILPDCWKTRRPPFDALGVNGGTHDMIDNFPFTDETVEACELERLTRDPSLA
jgi:hypothetical protein